MTRNISSNHMRVKGNCYKATNFIILKFWRQTNDAMTTSFGSNQSLDLCGHKMRTSLGLEPRPLITSSREPYKPGCVVPLRHDVPGTEQVGTHIYVAQIRFLRFLFITCLQTTWVTLLLCDTNLFISELEIKQILQSHNGSHEIRTHTV